MTLKIWGINSRAVEKCIDEMCYLLTDSSEE